MIEVIFLGISSALPMRDSANAAYLVRAGNECILIDCGPAILQQLDAVGISPAEITHVFITHRHADHCLGYPMLMLWYELQLGESKAPPTLLATQFTFDALDTVMATVLGRIAGVTESAPRIVLPQDAPGQAQIHPNILLRTLPMAHSPFAPSIGIRIETRGALGDHAIAFTGDTGPTENVVHLARDADLLVHEATLSVTLTPDQPDGFAGHSTAQRAGMNARAANVRKLALTHIDARDAQQRQILLEEAAREFSGHVFIPVSGLSVVVE